MHRIEAEVLIPGRGNPVRGGVVVLDGARIDYAGSAAMAPQTLRVSGELADGILPYLAAPKVLAEHIIPELDRAAQAAGRARPRIVAFVPGFVSPTMRGRSVAVSTG